MTEPQATIPDTSRKTAFKISPEECGEKSEREHRRNIEFRASFYEKLIALNAGSIAIVVSVGAALVTRSEPSIRSVHSQLTWLLWIALVLVLSLVCSLLHNFLYVKITGLEADQAEDYANYIALLNGMTFGSKEIAEIVTKHLGETLHQRITKGAMNMHQTKQSEYRCVVLGKIAVWTFLFAYLEAVLGLVYLWHITR